MSLKLVTSHTVFRQSYHRQKTGPFHSNTIFIPSKRVTEEYLSSTCKCFQEWEEKEVTCLVYFNSRTISYFVQQSYEAGFKICGEKRKLIGLQLGHHFQTAHPIQVLQCGVGFFLHHTGFFTAPGRAHWLRNLKQLRSTDWHLYVLLLLLLSR